MVDKTRSVLVVDDDDAVRTMVVRQLSESYTVYQAADAQSALTVLASIKPPSLIVCDWMMPGMNGVELIKHLKSHAQFKSVPVIFLTAKTSPLDVIEGINSGARHYITKPFQMKDLLEKVAKAIK